MPAAVPVAAPMAVPSPGIGSRATRDEGQRKKENRMLRTTIVGSLPKPSWLAQPNALFAPWRLDGAALGEAQDDAVRLALSDQADAGIEIVTDGEQRRRHYIWGFLAGLTGIDT